MNKFLTIFEEVMNSLDTKRKGIKKVNQMSNRDFLKFLRELLPLFKDNELDLNTVTITEKIDGTAIRLVMINNELLFESSNSGVTTWDNMPFPEQTKFLKEHFEQSFINISKELNADFKVIGELIWVEGAEENGKITPVGASYLTNKFGSIGGIVIFDVKKIENNILTDFSYEEEFKLLSKLKSLNDDKFVFYDKSDIVLNENIRFKLNATDLLKLLNLPEYNKLRYSAVKDKAILNSIEQIRTEVVEQLENIINSTQGKFSEAGDLIEGIVLKINNSGNQYGIFSNGYKNLKAQYAKYAEKRDKLVSEFYKSVFGYSMLSAIKKNFNKNNINLYKEKYNKNFPIFLTNYKKCYEDLISDNTIPKGTKNAQLSIFKKRINDFEQLNTFDAFMKKYQF